jgi:hypothetical protein
MAEVSASVVRHDCKKERSPFCRRSPVSHDASGCDQSSAWCRVSRCSTRPTNLHHQRSLPNK